MTCIGFESTAHSFGVGVFDGKARANEKAMYRTSGGIHPREASQFMTEHAHEVLATALEKANTRVEDADCIAFAQGPGLGPCLRVGAGIARTLANYYDLPLVGVNHCVAHIDVGKWACKLDDPLVVYVSGANTQVLGLKDKRYRVYGETLDMGMGNALDALGRDLGLGFPAGPKMEELARKGKKLIELPYTVKGMDLAFSGILTAAKKLAAKNSVEDVCFSFQEHVFAMLVEVTERALAHTKKKEVLLVGGVAQNSRLKEMMAGMAAAHGASFSVPPNEYNADNGLMIALSGQLMHDAHRDGAGAIDQFWRSDDVEVTW
jgi:universal protein Kae1